MPRLFRAHRDQIMPSRGAVVSHWPRRFVARSDSAPPERKQRSGFSLVETMFALAVLSIAGSAVLTAIAGGVTACNDSIFRRVGRGLAEQLMDEIAASRFPAATSNGSAGVTNRSNFTTIDDYSGWSESPTQIKSGIVLGWEQPIPDGEATGGGSPTELYRPEALRARIEFLQRFSRSVLVERVQPSDTGWIVLNPTQDSLYRRVTVAVSYKQSGSSAQPVASLVRVFANVPSGL